MMLYPADKKQGVDSAYLMQLGILKVGITWGGGGGDSQET